MSKMSLSIQLPLVRMVISDAFDNVRISLLFVDAFPDAFATLGAIKAALIAAAGSRLPKAEYLHRRLVCDSDYMAKMIQLVSRTISVRMGLMPFTATRSCTAFPSGSQRPLCGDHTCRLFGHQFSGEDRRDR